METEKYRGHHHVADQRYYSWRRKKLHLCDRHAFCHDL